MRKSKTWLIDLFNTELVMRRQPVTQIQNDEFWTSDTEAYLNFKVSTQEFIIDTAKINLYNKDDGTLVQRDMTIENNEAQYELPQEIIAHYGKWNAQVVFISGAEHYTSPMVDFEVKRTLGDSAPEKLGIIVDWLVFESDAKELIDLVRANEQIREYNELDREQAEAQRVLTENERSAKYANYAQQFNDVITDLSEEKDYHSLPEISGARGGFDTLGNRLDDTDAQLVQTDVTHHQTEAVKSFPVGSKGGSVKDFEYKGQTLFNSVRNGDFSDNSKWVIEGGNSVFSENRLTATGGGTHAYIRAINITEIKGLQTGQKVFIYSRQRVTTSDGINFRILVRDGASGVVSGHVGDTTGAMGQWKDVYGIHVPTVDFTSNLAIFLYADGFIGGQTLGESLEIDGNAGVFAINMTQLGIEDYTEEQMLELVRGGYFDGMQSAKADVKTVGKNLLDSDKMINGQRILEDSGEIYTSAPSSLSDWIPVKPNTDYVIPESNGGSNNRIGFYSTNNLDSFIEGHLEISKSDLHVTSPENAKYCRVSTITAFVDMLQLEEGSTVTPYEPYKSSTLTVEPTLHRLPNGMADRVFEKNRQLWLEKRVSVGIPLSDFVWNHHTTADTDTTYNLYCPFRLNWDGANGVLVSGASYIVNSNILTKYSNLVTNNLHLNVPKNLFSGAPTTLEFTEWALNNNIKVWVEIETQLINLTEQGLATGELMSYANGTSYNNGSLKGEVSFKVPTSTGAQITSLVGSSERQAKQIAVLSDHVAQLISGV